MNQGGPGSRKPGSRTLANSGKDVQACGRAVIISQPFVLCTCIALIYEKNKKGTTMGTGKCQGRHSGSQKSLGGIFNLPAGLIFHGLWLEILVPIRKSPGECAVRVNRKFHRK